MNLFHLFFLLTGLLTEPMSLNDGVDDLQQNTQINNNSNHIEQCVDSEGLDIVEDGPLQTQAAMHDHVHHENIVNQFSHSLNALLCTLTH